MEVFYNGTLTMNWIRGLCQIWRHWIQKWRRPKFKVNIWFEINLCLCVFIIEDRRNCENNFVVMINKSHHYCECPTNSNSVCLSLYHSLSHSPGMKELAPPSLNLRKLYSESIASEPILIVISTGADPSQELQDLATDTVGFDRYHQVCHHIRTTKHFIFDLSCTGM